MDDCAGRWPQQACALMRLQQQLQQELLLQRVLRLAASAAAGCCCCCILFRLFMCHQPMRLHGDSDPGS